MGTRQQNSEFDRLSEAADLDGMEHRMRAATVCAMAISITLMTGAVWAQNRAAPASVGGLETLAQRPACHGNPEALGVARVVEIDTTGGPGFGFEHFKA